jgi:hypothetical protein
MIVLSVINEFAGLMEKLSEKSGGMMALWEKVIVHLFWDCTGY